MCDGEIVRTLSECAKQLIELLRASFPLASTLRKVSLMQVTIFPEVAREIRDVTFSGNFSEMAAKKAATGRGRPMGIYLTPDQVDVMADTLQSAVTYLKDAAKHMREDNLPKILVSAAKVIDEHIPIAANFAAKLFAEVGPASMAYRLGRKSRLELNQERHAKQKARKDPQ